MRTPAKVSTSTKPYATLTARDLLDGIRGGSTHDAFNLARRVERVLALHIPLRIGDTVYAPEGVPMCAECREDWPCPTVRALDGETLWNPKEPM